MLHDTINPQSHESERETSLLSPELQKFIRTPEFREWFGDWENDPAGSSMIVDKNGEPALVYTGLPSGIKELHGDSRDHTGSDEQGFYFTKRPNNARFYARTRRHPVTDEPIPSSVYSAFLNIRAPYEKRPGDNVRTERVTSRPDGYDGYINDEAQEIVVFSPDQVLFVHEEPLV